MHTFVWSDYRTCSRPRVKSPHPTDPCSINQCTHTHTLTVLAVCRDFKAGVADAVEAALSVHTASVVADTTVSHTLVQI